MDREKYLIVKKILSKHYGGNIFTDIYDSLTEFKDRVVGFFTGARKEAPPQFRRFIEEHGNKKIDSIIICRSPIQSYINYFLNFITFGKFEEALKSLDYDKLFHLYMIIVLDDNTSFRIEKNEVVKVEMTYEGCNDFVSAPITYPIKVIDFFENGIKQQPEDFFLYNAKNNNCQVFITSLLNGNNINTPKINNFVKQDAISIFQQMPEYAEKVSNFITDLGARFDIIRQGNGFVMRKRRRKRRLPKKIMRKPFRRI